MHNLSRAPQRNRLHNARGITLLEITLALALTSLIAFASVALYNFTNNVLNETRTDPANRAAMTMAWLARPVQLANWVEVDPDNQGFSARLDYAWASEAWNYTGTPDQADDFWLRVRLVGNTLRYIAQPGVQPPVPDAGATALTDLPASNVSFTMVNPDGIGNSSTLRLAMTLGADAKTASTLSMDMIAMEMSAQ